MSRTRNATEFLANFRNIIRNYDDTYGPMLTRLREAYIPNDPRRSILDLSLEAHSREYLVNALLAALNWRLGLTEHDGLPNLVPEATTTSIDEGTKRRLDYLGFERDTAKPLLVVETKRPSAILPLPPDAVGMSDVQLETRIGEVIADYCSPCEPENQWARWIGDVRDYAQSVNAVMGKPPRRVVITNGTWVVVFLDPANAFINQEGEVESSLIKVFATTNSIESRSAELFRSLEYSSVLERTDWLTPGDVGFHVEAETVDRAMYGLRVRYIEQRRIYELSPVITVAPFVLVGSRFGTWVRVETPPGDYELPHRRNELGQHLEDVRRTSESLLAEIQRRLSVDLRLVPLRMHYEDEDAFELYKGVTEISEGEFIVLTGEYTHFIRQQPSVHGCPYHDWASCHEGGVQSVPGPIVVRSISPRAFFVSGETHHCAHRDVGTAKASRVTAANICSCGPRSGNEGAAFCEIWAFEEHLCCRTCAFEDVCTSAAAFRLPCDNARN